METQELSSPKEIYNWTIWLKNFKKKRVINASKITQIFFRDFKKFP